MHEKKKPYRLSMQFYERLNGFGYTRDSRAFQNVQKILASRFCLILWYLTARVYWDSDFLFFRWCEESVMIVKKFAAYGCWQKFYKSNLKVMDLLQFWQEFFFLKFYFVYFHCVLTTSLLVLLLTRIMLLTYMTLA